jgi:hypothetical protein
VGGRKKRSSRSKSKGKKKAEK